MDLKDKLNKERRQVDVNTNNFPARELVRMIVDGELNISPAYQRKFRWTNETESALIESIFLGLPIPTIFVATNEGFEWEVVDGLQRLSTITHFISSDTAELKMVGKESPLRLSGLDKVPQLNGLTYSDLSKELQIYFSRQPLQVTALTDKSDESVRFDLFERLNRGAIELSGQEVRACIYRSPFLTSVEKLADTEKFKSLIKLQSSKQDNGTREETVLKYFAYRYARHRFTGKVKDFLNEYCQMEGDRMDPDQVEKEFTQVVEEMVKVLDGKHFVRSDYSVTPLVQFEACLVAIGELLSEGKDIAKSSGDWVDDEILKAASVGGTNTQSMLTKRIERAKELLTSKVS
jgi:hypothetical protein